MLGTDPEDALWISAKTGIGVPEVLEAIVARIPAPTGEVDAPARALIFDSEFDQYRGVIAYVRMFDGRFRKGERILAMQNGTRADIDDLGFFRPAMTAVKDVEAGDVGYLITGIKDVTMLRVGDTLTADANPATEPLQGYREVRPMVFCGLFPIDTDRFEELRDALEKLSLNDAALSWSRRPRRRSASASAAASSASSTWRSCASGSSASTTSTCWRRPERAHSSTSPTAANARSTAPPTSPTRPASRGSKSPTSAPRSSARKSRSGR